MRLASRRAPSAYFRNYGLELELLVLTPVSVLLPVPLVVPLELVPAPAPELDVPELELPGVVALPWLLWLLLPEPYEPELVLLGVLLDELVPLLVPVLSLVPPLS